MIRVLIVEDQPVAAAAHAAYLARVPGFLVAGHARTTAEALRLLSSARIDLVLLDIYLPDGDGLDVVRAMRATGHRADVIIVTKARDLAVVRAAVSYGVVHYLIKPFTFAMFREKLERYLGYRHQLTLQPRASTQQVVDHLLETLHGASAARLPRNVNRESLDAVVAVLRNDETGTGMSAAQVAEAVGVSRVTARRYLEYLAETHLVERHARYREGGGRPEVEFRLRSGNGIAEAPA